MVRVIKKIQGVSKSKAHIGPMYCREDAADVGDGIEDGSKACNHDSLNIFTPVSQYFPVNPTAHLHV